VSRRRRDPRLTRKRKSKKENDVAGNFCKHPPKLPPRELCRMCRHKIVVFIGASARQREKEREDSFRYLTEDQRKRNIASPDARIVAFADRREGLQVRAARIDVNPLPRAGREGRVDRGANSMRYT